VPGQLAPRALYLHLGNPDSRFRPYGSRPLGESSVDVGPYGVEVAKMQKSTMNGKALGIERAP